MTLKEIIEKMKENDPLNFIMKIYELYKSYFTTPPFIQQNGETKLLIGDEIIIKNELNKYLSDLEKINELQEKTCKFINKDERDNIYYECSYCGMDWVFDDGTPKENEYNYCPHCGLKINHERK